MLEPPKEYARMRWMQHLHDSMGIIINLPKLQAVTPERQKLNNMGEPFRALEKFK